MPQSRQIIGVNSVTNIELDKGVMPAPIIRNAYWSGKLPGRFSDLRPLPGTRRQMPEGVSLRIRSLSLILTG
ncbi:hypothetical protein CES87_07595 [Pseudomonas sp. ERMR1:02]|nr:hypothetical protein CES87_07595 [Pseudomonas sp. ERMR1:02]